MIDKETIEKISKLARLEFSEKEKEDLVKKLSNILGYVENLQSIDTTGVEITYNPNGFENQFRKDEVKESMPRELVLQNAPDKDVGCFKVPKVLD